MIRERRAVRFDLLQDCIAVHEEHIVRSRYCLIFNMSEGIDSFCQQDLQAPSVRRM